LAHYELVEHFTDPVNRRSVVMRCTLTDKRAARRLSDQRRELMDLKRRATFGDLLEEDISLIEQYAME
jgi:hypothetical protein